MAIDIHLRKKVIFPVCLSLMGPSLQIRFALKSGINGKVLLRTCDTGFLKGFKLYLSFY